MSNPPFLSPGATNNAAANHLFREFANQSFAHLGAQHAAPFLIATKTISRRFGGDAPYSERPFAL